MNVPDGRSEKRSKPESEYHDPSSEMLEQVTTGFGAEADSVLRFSARRATLIL